MARGLDIQAEKQRTLRLAEEALIEARDYLGDIEDRMVSGEAIDQDTIDRMNAVVNKLEKLIGSRPI